MRNRFLGVQISGCICRQNSYTTVANQKLGNCKRASLQYSNFFAETCLIPIMITKGPQLITKTNIPFLIPRWWRLCTDIKIAYASGCGNESNNRAKESRKSAAIAVGI